MTSADPGGDEENGEVWDEAQEDAPTLNPAIQEAIGKALRAYCGDIVSAPIPDKFLALLAKLEASERKG